MKKILSILFIAILACALCSCGKSENTDLPQNTTVPTTTESNSTEPKKLVEQYTNTIDEENPNFLKINGDKFTVWFVDYNRDFGYDDYDKNNDFMNYYNYSKDFVPIVQLVDDSTIKYQDSKERELNREYSLKAYTRYIYENNKLVNKTTKVNRTLHTLQLKIRNSSDDEVTLTKLPEIKFIKDDSYGNQSFVKEKVYKDKNGKVQKETTPIYVYPSANQSSTNYSKYCSIKFKPKETKIVTFRYILDNDLYNSAYFCLENEDKTLYKKLSYDYD